MESLAGAAPRLWARMAWPEVEAMLASGEDLALLPLGATEQHGPHLPLDVDSVFATAFCAYASARTGVPVLPTLTYGCSLGHTDRWPGTVSLFPETLIANLREITDFLIRTGLKRLLVVNSHWGNASSARCAIDRVRFDHYRHFQIGFRNTFDLTPSVWKQFTDDGDDFHANRAETALMLYLDPDAVRTDLLPSADDPDRTAGKVFTYPVPQTSKNGVTGLPTRATADDGENLFREIGDELVRLVTLAKIEQPPLATPPSARPA